MRDLSSFYIDKMHECEISQMNLEELTIIAFQTFISQDFLFHMIGGILILVTSIILVSGTYPGSCGVMEKTSAAVSYICIFLLHIIKS